jgi:hypothetical protein
MKKPIEPWQLLLICVLITVFLFFITSCKKENYQQTKIFATMRAGSDNMLHNSPLYCYPGDTKKVWDTVFYINGLEPNSDTNHLYLDVVIYTPTGRIDSSFVFAGQIVNLIGPIEHREYSAVWHINKIVYGTK